MKDRGLSGRELAKQTGLPYKSLAEWIGQGSRFPRDPAALKKLADFFGVSIHHLLYGEEDPQSILAQLIERTEIHTGMYEITVKRVKVKG
jgi:transcriptional regulator with XRE-family HTH domain